MSGLIIKGCKIERLLHFVKDILLNTSSKFIIPTETAALVHFPQLYDSYP